MSPLTRAEQAVYDLAVEGLSIVEMGERLFVVPKTIKFHLTPILRKLQCKNRIELCVKHYKALLANAQPGLPPEPTRAISLEEIRSLVNTEALALRELDQRKGRE